MEKIQIEKKVLNSNRKKVFLILTSFIVLIAITLLSMKLGSIDIEFNELIVGLLTNSNDPTINLIKDLRMPRVIVALLVGANLALAGVLLQSIIRNPLADPSVTGISAGASFASVIILIFFPKLNSIRPIFGFIGGLTACSFVYILAYKKGISAIRIVLAGIAINAMLVSLTSMSNMYGSNNSASIQLWLNGSLANITWNDVRILAIYSAIGYIAAFMLYRSCDVIILGEKNVKSLGINYDLQMALICLVAVFLGSTATAVGGIISFVGLIVPHICRMIIGSGHKYLVPFSITMGGILLLIADTIARYAFKPIEIPVGLVMAVIGGPVFLYLLRRSDV